LVPPRLILKYDELSCTDATAIHKTVLHSVGSSVDDVGGSIFTLQLKVQVLVTLEIPVIVVESAAASLRLLVNVGRR
jgi:hypothetical protein